MKEEEEGEVEEEEEEEERGQPVFFCSAGICACAAAELNNTRPEAKLKCYVLKIARTKPKHIFYSALAVKTLCPRVLTAAPTSCTIFSLTHPVVVDTRYI
jgi:hypothetical protein